MGAMAGTADRELVGLVESAIAGDELAFARIVSALHEQGYTLAKVVWRDRTMAEEAESSTWSKVWRKLGSVRDADRLRPWVVSIAFNEAKQVLRRRRRWFRHEVVPEPAEAPGGVDPATGVPGIDLRLAVQELDPDDRALLTMRYVLGFDSTELSTATGPTPSGVRSRLERPLARLRQELE